MIRIINPDNRDAHWDLLDRTFLLRDEIFNGRLEWDLPTIMGREIDQYDRDDTYYLIAYEKELGVYGGCRLLPTTTPYMLEKTFEQIDCGPLPKRDDVWECSRFFIDNRAFKDASSNLVKRATYELMIGLLEFGFYKNLKDIITPSDIRVERIFRMAGCPMERLSKPVEIGNTLAIGANVNVLPEYLDNLQQKSGIEDSVLLEV